RDLHRRRDPRRVLPRSRRRGLPTRARRGGRDGRLLRALRREARRHRPPLHPSAALPRRAPLVIVASPPPLVCLDPGHGTPPAIGRQAEPIGPGSGVLKIKDGGGASGEAAVNLAIAKKTQTLLLRRGYRVAMTRTGSVFSYGNGGNIARAQFCNRRHAALMLRIHADGAADRSLHGFATLYP